MTTLDRSALRVGDSATLKTLDHIARAIAHQEAAKFGIPSDGDDIAQTIMVQFLAASDTPRPDENATHIEGYLRVAAQHRAQNIKHLRNKTQPLDSIPEVASEPPAESEDDAGRQHRSSAQKDELPKQTRQRRSKRSPMVRLATEIDPPLGHLDEDTPVTSQIVRRVRDTWGLTQQQMALALGTSTHTLRNYEYGEVKEIPKMRRDAVRRLHNDRLAERRMPIAGGGFLAIANQWLGELGYPPGDYIALSEILHKPRSTTWRWFNQPASHPSMGDISRFGSIVNELIEARRTHVRKVRGK